MGQLKAPGFFYGTAWKEEKTAALTLQALEAGFTAVDTANQRKHYYEQAVGEGLKQFLAQGSKRREDLFLQTKFTYAGGQDHRKPYNEDDPFTKQVADSFKSSLEHLHTDYLDSYVLHGPYKASGIQPADLETWAAMEQLHQQKKVHHLGISNVSAKQLIELCAKVNVKPSFVQNRCFAKMGWDKQVREICKAQGLQYQGFSLLTANRMELADPAVEDLADKYGKTVPQIVFRFCRHLGMICLTGTSNPQHMKQDLSVEDFELSPDEISKIENLNF
ncbi:MAG: aldo/keto reductase family protein [Bdellovibrionales bacterium]